MSVFFYSKIFWAEKLLTVSIWTSNFDQCVLRMRIGIVFELYSLNSIRRVVFLEKRFAEQDIECASAHSNNRLIPLAIRFRYILPPGLICRIWIPPFICKPSLLLNSLRSDIHFGRCLPFLRTPLFPAFLFLRCTLDIALWLQCYDWNTLKYFECIDCNA